MVKNTFEVSVGKFCGLELKDIWHCRRNICRSSRLVLSNPSGAQAWTWLTMGALTGAGGAGGLVSASLSRAQMKCWIRSSCPLVGTVGFGIAAWCGTIYWGNCRVDSGGGWVGSAECDCGGMFGKLMVENPSGDGFSTSRVDVRPSTSDSLSPSPRFFLVCGSCSPTCTIGVVGGVAGSSIGSVQNSGIAAGTCKGNPCTGASSLIIWEKHPVLSQWWCHRG